MGRRGTDTGRSGLGSAAPLGMLLALLVAASCGTGPVETGPVETDLAREPPAAGATSATRGAASLGSERSASAAVGSTVSVDLPPIPPIVLPELAALGAVGDVVADRLGELVAPVNGVDVVAAQCEDEGGELVFQGTSSGDDVFAIGADGSGIYRDETDDGLVTLEVEPDGTGRYYQETPQGLVTIGVEPDGSGQYYDDRNGGLVTVERSADGTGRYYDDRNGLVTIVLELDGSAEYYRKTDDGLVTIDAAPDGSGQFYWRRAGEVTTVAIEGDGAWVLSQTAADHRLELAVEPSGAGRYVRTGLRPLSLEFDSQGLTAEGGRIDVPARPVLTAEPFGPLGKLGSLAPPCAAVIRLDASLLFEFGESDIRPEASATLEQVASALVEAGKPIQVNGHTDSVGSDEYNLELSRRRAEAVERALRSRGLTTPIEVDGFGESQPVAPNETHDGEDDPAGRARNRRVEIVVPETEALPAGTR